MGNEEGTNPSSKYQQKLDPPETILNVASWITRGPYTNHKDCHQGKENCHYKADSVDSQVTNGILTR